ncbi:ribbon-helix-helix protein, CopG family [Candidatus Bathyarchaeota archaeon]|nr:ribbon-helix-helix protein, CopG family [Candidatus Bathyarchaeota archaeon]
MKSDNVAYATISIPIAIAEEIDELIGELGYWPSRSAFVREACIEKLRREREKLKELQEARKD